MKKTLFFSALIVQSFSWGQVSADAIQKALETKKQMESQSLFQNVVFDNVGPTVMSGRVVDVDVNPENPIEFYVGYASGGLWYTNNNGMSFSPVMDSAPTQNVGDIAIDWKRGTIWVGTGEVNSSRSSYAGIGILKSEDKGKTWQNMGLLDSHHISRILINPSNADEVVVGVVGHLYSKNEERGIFKTTNGGKTWNKTLYIDDETGIIDVVVSPKNFNVQYAASWSKDRKAWDFIGSGATSGIYKSEDAGLTWKLFTTAESGFPVGEGVGRIGLAVYDDATVYAVLDNQFKRPLESKKSNSLPIAFSVPGDEFLKIPNKSLNSILKNYGLTEKFRAENIKHWIQNGYLQPNEAAKVVLEAINSLAEKEVIGAEVYKSSNGGKNWTKTHPGFIDDFFYSYGYYFSVISVDPNDVNKIYLSGVPIIKSNDGGITFTSISEDNVHADHHVVWVNPNKSGHLINGNDGGLNISYDDGAHWFKGNSHGVSQFYAVNVDEQEPYNIYGGMQDNGVWVGPSNYKFSSEWYQTGKYPYENLIGGDGMQIQIDKRNPNIVFTGFQFGNYYRIDRANNKRDYISPVQKKGEKPFRYNWQTPILLSSHNQEILYMGSNFFLEDISMDDSVERIVGKVMKSNVRTIEATARTLDYTVLERCAAYLKRARAVNLFGIGASRLVAHDLAQKLMRVDKECHLYDDWHDQLLCAKNMHEGDMAIAFSYSGLTQEVLDCTAEAQRHNCPVVAVTKVDGSSKLATMADAVLGVAASEPLVRSGAMASRMAQLMVVDALYAAYVASDYERATHVIKQNYIEKQER